MNKLFIPLFVFAAQFAFALQNSFVGLQSPTAATTSRHQFYYGEKFYHDILGQADDLVVKDSLKEILKSGHIVNDNQFDQVVANCDGLKNCESHFVTGYDRARVFLFGKFYLVPLDASRYGIKEMYCDRVYQDEDFKQTQKPGPGIVPDSTVINVEHTWPQSKFSKRYPKEMQKSDLHHLYPTDSMMNSLRGNTIFGEVHDDKGKTKCAASKYGTGTAGSTELFEPPDDHKGRVARSLFYFSVRYDMPIRTEEEVILKKWNQEHPVEQNEMDRNDEIEKLQQNRNPFVDYPELAQQIGDF